MSASSAASTAGEAERLCQEAHALMSQHQYQKALPLFEKAASLGSADAQFAVGASFDNEGPEGSFVKAREYYGKAAAQEHQEALLQLGVLHWRGEGGEKDFGQAMELFKRSAALNNAEAQFNLAVMHMRGEGVEKSESQSLEWCTKAANGGHPMAQYHLSTLYETGTGGVEKSVEKQKEWLRKAAAQGFMRAQMHLRQLEAVDMDPKNLPSEEQLEAMPAEQLFSTGMAALQAGGIVHGVNCLQKAAAKGEVNAMMLLSQLHRAGRFVAQSDARAFELMKQAADKDHPQAKHGLADFYMKGVATDKDVKKAIQLLTEAGTRNVLPAQLALVNLYEKGFENVVEPNISEMQLWLALAAEGGHPLAQMKFAVLYFEGKTGPTGDVPQNYEKAAHWFNKAATSGVPDAYLALADMYADGLGVEKSEEKSNEFKQRAQTMMMMRGGHGHGHGGGHGHSHGGGAHGHSHGGQPCHGHGH